MLTVPQTVTPRSLIGSSTTLKPGGPFQADWAMTWPTRKAMVKTQNAPPSVVSRLKRSGNLAESTIIASMAGVVIGQGPERLLGLPGHVRVRRPVPPSTVALHY